jgi:hypothetical protein
MAAQVSNGYGFNRASTKYTVNPKPTGYDPGENTRLANEQRQNSYMNAPGSGVNRNGSKVNKQITGYLSQHKPNKISQDQQILSTASLEEDTNVEKYMLQQEIQKLNQQLMQMKKVSTLIFSFGCRSSLRRTPSSSSRRLRSQTYARKTMSSGPRTPSSPTNSRPWSQRPRRPIHARETTAMRSTHSCSPFIFSIRKLVNAKKKL